MRAHATGLFWVTLTLLACGGRTDDGSSAAGDAGGDRAATADTAAGGSFVGSWSCSSIVTMTDADGGSIEGTTTTLTTVTITEGSDGTLTLSDMSDAGDCVTTATASGQTLSIAGGQMCTAPPGLVTTETGGSATLTGSTYVLHSTFTMYGYFLVNVGGESREEMVSGAGTVRSTCTRM